MFLLSQGLIFTELEQDNDDGRMLSREPQACEEGFNLSSVFSARLAEDVKHLQDTLHAYCLFALPSHSQAAPMLGCFLTFYNGKVGCCLWINISLQLPWKGSYSICHILGESHRGTKAQIKGLCPGLKSRVRVHVSSSASPLRVFTIQGLEGVYL